MPLMEINAGSRRFHYVCASAQADGMDEAIKPQDRIQTMDAKRATALYGIETALSIIRLTRGGRLVDRLFVLNATFDSFSCGMFELAVDLARDAVTDPIHVSLPDSWLHATDALAAAAKRLQALATRRLH